MRATADPMTFPLVPAPPFGGERPGAVDVRGAARGGVPLAVAVVVSLLVTLTVVLPLALHLRADDLLPSVPVATGSDAAPRGR